MSDASESSNQSPGASEASPPGAPAGGGAGPRPAGADLARQALAEARARARERGASAGAGAPRRGADRRPRRPRGEPQMFGEAVRAWLNEHGWADQVAMGGVFGRWSEIVGEHVAQHVRPESFAEGELTVVADSTTWASQVRVLRSDLRRRLNEELGDGCVAEITVRGPGTKRRRGGRGS
ncbi:DUF721 domain-containing protein [Lipingzhangella sp. LS1_29]|uniref:DUF721 domain-containing protein n=1 Tax=Lipingzhangella rawalii TaxID=2055835 RepID=A0ABU2H9E6_9ACTN|nr:DUF721 domain-containing protein [Lipingzhangella rawalii]MDS1271479.1 DUF721 domain-containing protein [Lipingzhangella rawalii]